MYTINIQLLDCKMGQTKISQSIKKYIEIQCCKNKNKSFFVKLVIKTNRTKNKPPFEKPKTETNKTDTDSKPCTSYITK